MPTFSPPRGGKRRLRPVAAGLAAALLIVLLAACNPLPSIVQIAPGPDFTCARMSDETIRCWGSNQFGQLGDGTDVDSRNPVGVAGIATAVWVTAGANFACAQLSDRTVWCWGSNSEGQLGNGTTTNSNVPVKALIPIPFATERVDAGNGHVCAAALFGVVHCWGRNSDYQAGQNSPNPVTVPTAIRDESGSSFLGLTNVVNLSAGRRSTCALKSDKTAVCWGTGALANVTLAASILPVPVTGLTGITSVSVGDSHACATITDGSVRCWGYDLDGQLGPNVVIVPTEYRDPITVPGIAVDSVAAGLRNSCAVLTTGGIRCWGGTYLGTGALSQTTTPIAVSGVSSATSISGGYGNWCAVLSGNTARCWGVNDHSQLGDHTLDLRLAPVEVQKPHAPTFTKIATGGDEGGVGDHACGLLTTGQVMCWGSNSYGQLGNGTTTDSKLPVAVTGLAGALDIAVGAGHSCAQLDNGRVTCWGLNDNGQLGDGTFVDSDVPVPALGLADIDVITAGRDHTCANRDGGRLACWGRNDFGQVGDGTTLDRGTPVPVSGDLVFATSSAGSNSTCGTLADKTAYCWGRNDLGQLGNGTRDDSTTPVAVTDLTNATRVSVGGSAACATTEDATAVCWGSGRQLGNGLADDLSIPGPVVGLAGVSDVSVGGDHACARLTNGEAWCWGGQDFGQLGDGQVGGVTYDAAKVIGLGNAAQVVASQSGTCARLSTGGARCWGRNGHGQLGNGTTVDTAWANQFVVVNR